MRSLEDAARSSPSPEAVRRLFQQLRETGLGEELLEASSREVAAVAGASRFLGRLLLSDPLAIEALLRGEELDELNSVSSGEELRRTQRLSYLQIARDDLLGRASLDEVGRRLAELADASLRAACRIARTHGGLAVIAMGKHGAEELNYSSDVDIVFVADDAADIEELTARSREVLKVAGTAYRIDTDLRPEGRSGVLVRSLESYEAYWSRWASPWEFQALLKARPCAGDERLGHDFLERAEAAVYSRPPDAEALAELRSMKARAEAAVERRGVARRELKRGPGGIRDIEFSVQLLQLVHGAGDTSLRVRRTREALERLAAGYIDEGDAAMLSLAYQFLRTVEHRLQLVDGAQVHTVPPEGEARDHLARVLGFEDAGAPARQTRFETVLSRYQSSVRSIHERLFFRPLLEAFSKNSSGRLSEQAANERLAAFGFRDAERTRQALTELTRGLTRSSGLMKQLLPVLLGWLAETPDPDLGLLALRNLAGLAHQRDVVVAAFRDSPELARRLCVVLGTSRRLGELAVRYPQVTLRIGDDSALAARSHGVVAEQVHAALCRPGATPAACLARVAAEETLRVASGDVVGVLDARAVSEQLAVLADVVLAGALADCRPGIPFGVVAVGRLGGSELFYGSDLDVLLVHGGSGKEDGVEAERIASGLLRTMNGDTPSQATWPLDTSLRPEGRQGPLVRSLDAFAAYYDRWASPWERQSLLRARPVAGDHDLLDRFMALLHAATWERPLSEEDVREIRRLKARTERERIPAGEDPRFHLKLGRGSLADIEWTVQLLQLEHGVESPNTDSALDALEANGALSRDDARVFRQALSFLVRTRSRWHLVGNFMAGGGGRQSHVGADSLPTDVEALSRLARSLNERPFELRENYRRVTRRARAVVERRFYGL